MSTAAAVSPGRFIVVEGIDGAGTTTLSRGLVHALRQRGTRVRWTCEPSDGPVGALIRQILARRVVVPGAVEGAPGADTMALLFAADRMDHLETTIEPSLRDGTWVVCDRYYHSTLAYQGLGADFDWIRTLHRSVRVPDLTLILDLPPEVAAERRRDDPGRAQAELYETEETQRQLAERYLGLADRLNEPIDVLDARLAPEVMLEAALAQVDTMQET